MKILYISNFYTIRNSSAAIRNNAMVKGLTELGHQVDVLTVRQSETSTSPDLNFGHIIYTELFNLSLRSGVKKLVNNQVKTVLGEIYSRMMKILHFPDAYYKWPNKVNVALLKEYDLLISSSDGKISHFVGRKIKKTRPYLKWIQIWGDPWFDDLNSNLLDKIRIRHYEKAFLSEADKVVYISLPTCNAMKTRYTNIADKIGFIPRSYFKDFTYSVPKNEIEIHIAYTGALRSVYGRNLSPLLKAIEAYNKKEDGRSPKIMINVYGEVDNATRQEFRSIYVNFHHSVDVSELGNIYSKSNALLYISNKDGSTQIPGKLYDYLGTSSLVLCLVNNMEDEIASFLKELGPRCMLIKNEEKEIFSRLNEAVEKMKIEYLPDKAFSPRTIAQKLLNESE
ncbi:hypothetical protein [Phocaeicola abscessus]|uniref:hypothetical protein n=1 Tax=Phocaeicola abscessus TaxID=555313 RepID=UPI0012EA2A4A|nr:hypothetical protein [Phocaeicola abscessus]